MNAATEAEADPDPTLPAEIAPYEPTGGTTLVLTVEGRKMDMPLSHRAPLTLIYTAYSQILDIMWVPKSGEVEQRVCSAQGMPHV